MIMQTIIKHFRTFTGKDIKVESNEFTDEELNEMTPIQKKAILAFRKMVEESVKSSME
jgi:hypothetical protein